MALDSRPIKEAALREGFELAGVCPAAAPPHFDAYLRWLADKNHARMNYMSRSRELRSHPEKLLPGAKSILAVGLNYFQNTEKTPPRVARYALGRDYHKVLRAKLKRIAKWAETNYPGIQARPCVDSAPILERDFAQLAGLGWFGKNTCLINTKRGSWFFIGLLLLTEEFESDSPADGGCGTCRLCIDACPTGALVLKNGSSVASLDSHRCISYLTIEHPGDFNDEQKRNLNGWLYGCDICQEVCPFNQPREHQPTRSSITAEPDFQPRNQNSHPDLHHLTQITDADFLTAYAGTAFMRGGPTRLRRNARALTDVDARSSS